MQKKTISFCGQTLSIKYPSQATEVLNFTFAEFPAGDATNAVAVIEVLYDQETELFSATTSGGAIGTDLDRVDLSLLLSARAVYSLSHEITDGMAIHGAAVRGDSGSVLLPGRSGNSKLIAWLLAQGYGYLTARLLYIPKSTKRFNPLPCPLSIRQADFSMVEPVIRECIPSDDHLNRVLRNSTSLQFSHRIFTDEPVPEGQKLACLLFTDHKEDAPLSLDPVSPAQATQRLLGCLANNHTLGMQGFTHLAALTRQVPALSLQYADFEEMEGILPPIIDFALETECAPQSLQGILKVFSRLTSTKRTPLKKSFPVQQATPARKKRKITIGMATYDDFDGVFFSVQALRMYHPEIIDQCEILVIDNHPDGPCAEALKQLDTSIDSYRYVPLADVQGTAAGRDALFQHAKGDY
ncbi:MAG: hypothetical protein D3924_15395, partial [Candidatus Electrothrix sp. AR4]|nr:hypothetical protein [Candidatus Electrothrix sp. AR4]